MRVDARNHHLHHIGGNLKQHGALDRHGEHVDPEQYLVHNHCDEHVDKAIGIRGSSILAASRSVLDESSLGLSPYELNAGAGKYCHLVFQHMLFAKNVTVDKFVADMARSPCVYALFDYDNHVLESVNGPKPEPVTTVLTETITRVLTGSVAKPAIPDKEAIQRIRDYCQWNSGRDLTKMIHSSMTTTAGVMGALMAVVLATVTFVVAGMMPV
ncbi:hypothetical protein GGF31_000553 [Allomyces arbusculus]|nr:hypothetical protein GGF31_000553 [Allomyces arbusculus]